tara:strand:+ start:67 stop:978 length:912 start_codon:yes stop_codon:yes gene_type:complete
MNLLELCLTHPWQRSESVPEWMLGMYRRRTITFANGMSDSQTRVFWLQSAGLTIDLRLPLVNHQKLVADAPEEVADYEAWYAHSVWADTELRWRAGISFQERNRWPEAAHLQRVGNCMMEFAPSGVYVEDWRLQNKGKAGALIGLELVSETDLTTHTTRIRKGALIIAGKYAGMILDYPKIYPEMIESRAPEGIAKTRPEALLEFYAAVGESDTSGGYVVTHALHATDVGQPVTSMEGFSLAEEVGFIRQELTENGRKIERLYWVDIMQPAFDFDDTTPVGAEAEAWFHRENKTLSRYMKKQS